MKNIRIDKKKVRLGVALLLSNVFFFLLFSGGEAEQPSAPAAGWVEVKLTGQSHTPFESGKKILLVHKKSKNKVEGQMKAMVSESDSTFHVSVPEKEAHKLFQHEGWEILPHLSNYEFRKELHKENHEIIY